MGLFYQAKLDAFLVRWKKRNRHNNTSVRCLFPIERVSVGKKTYGELFVLSFNKTNNLKIGNYVSIGPEVSFILSADHALNRVSTFPFRTKVINGEPEGISKGDIIVDDDAWIGHGATILSGVHIGQGAVIAAGAVVNKDVPPYAVAGGVPAKTIRFRFEQTKIDYLMTLDYGRLDDEMIKAHAREMEMELDHKSLDEMRECFDWFPKKAGTEETAER